MVGNDNVLEVRSIKDVRLGRRLGSGAFGAVRRAVIIGSQKPIAIKSISKRRISKKGLKAQLQREVQIHQKMNHPNIVACWGCLRGHDRIYLVLEYASHGDLYNYHQKHPIPLVKLKQILHQTAQALLYCHQHRVVHRDVKPDNVLLTSKLVPKLTDFGYCAVVDENGWLDSTEVCGTLDYLAPELITANKRCGFAIDVWSFGVTIYDLLVGQPPFEGKDQGDTYRKINTCRPNLYVAPLDEMAQCRSLLRQLLVYDQTKRLSMKALTQHPWLAIESESRNATNVADNTSQPP